MKTIYYFSLFFVSILSFGATEYAKNCYEQKDEMGNFWTKSEGRTQGGGWIWFTGKGNSKDPDTARLISEGQSLDLLNQECQNIPITSKFIERCSEKTDYKTTQYFSRISVKQKFCNPKMKLNKVLSSRLKEYKNMISMQEHRSLDCNQSTCDNYGNFEYLAKNYKKAKIYWLKGCKEFSDISSCFNLAYYSEMKEMYKLACDYGSWNACYNYANILEDKKLFSGFVYYKKACDNGVLLSCTAVGIIYAQKNKLELAETYYSKICTEEFQSTLAYVEGCYNYMLLLNQKGYFSKTIAIGPKICESAFKVSGPACNTLGRAYHKKSLLIKNKIKESNNYWSKAKHYYTKGCDIKKDPYSCLSLALSGIRSKELYRFSCENGLTIACKHVNE